MKKKFFGTCLLLLTVYCLLFVCFLLSGCKNKQAQAPAERVMNVHVYPAEKRLLRPFIRSVGTLNPYEEVVISAELDGILKDLRVNEGSAVSKGQLLAVIDDIDYSLEVKRAEAALRQSEATLANTKMEYQRKESLYKEQLVTQQQFDDVLTRVLLSEAEVERAKAALSLAGQKLSKTRIHSPLSGAVKEKKVERGNLVKNGTPLFSVIKNSPIKINFTVTEKDLSRLKINQDVVFVVDAYPDREFNGTVSIIYPSLVENTRSLHVEALAPNHSGLLKPGLFAGVVLYTGDEKETVLVPATSLLYEGDKVKVFVGDGETARERDVKIGLKYRLPAKFSGREPTVGTERRDLASGFKPEMREFTEVIQGLKEGELVVTVGQQNLFEGAKINIVSGQGTGD
jgi:RND family efflux transporter MFP subunit